MKTTRFSPAIVSTMLIGGLLLAGCSSTVEAAGTVSATSIETSSASATATVGELTTGAVATEGRPTGSLPRRRSKLRPSEG